MLARDLSDGVLVVYTSVGNKVELKSTWLYLWQPRFLHSNLNVGREMQCIFKYFTSIKHLIISVHYFA